MVQTRSQGRKRNRNAGGFVDEQAQISLEEIDDDDSDDEEHDPTLGGFIVPDGVETDENAPHPRLARFQDDVSQTSSDDEDDVPLSVMRDRLEESQRADRGTERKRGSREATPEEQLSTLPISFNMGRKGTDVTTEEFVTAGVYLENWTGVRYSIGLERGDREWNLHIQGVALAKVRGIRVVSEFTAFSAFSAQRGDFFHRTRFIPGF